MTMHPVPTRNSIRASHAALRWETWLSGELQKVVVGGSEGLTTAVGQKIAALPPYADSYSLMRTKRVRVEPLRDADETAQAASRTY